MIALESARKLLEYPIQRFASGHGVVRNGGQSELRESIRRADAASA